MWTQLSHIIIKYRLPLIVVLGLITLFFAYFAQYAEINTTFVKAVPDSDEDMQYFQQFKETFGEDGNMVALGVLDSSLYRPENFKKFKELSSKLAELEGVNDVLSLPMVFRMVKDTENTRFNVEPIFKEIPSDQKVLDSLLKVVNDQKFFSSRLSNENNGAQLILVSIKREVLNSANRNELTDKIIVMGEEFEADTGINMHFAGLPFVRSVIRGAVASETTIFLALSILVTGFIMLLFFRSWDAVVFPLTIIGVVVVWVIGTLGLLDYKITLLAGLIPPLIVVIGIPNSVYLLNKYHQEFEKHGNKVKAISRVTRKIGLVTLITNFTTAVGFLVLLSTDIQILREFGIVAGLNIMGTFVVSIILIPAVFSWLPSPTVKQLKHLQLGFLDTLLTVMDGAVHKYRTVVYTVTIVLIVLGAIGTYKVVAVSKMVDDLPEESQIYRDLSFFEEHFSGVMPLEIVIDTKKRRGVLDLENLKKIEEFEQFLTEQKYISKPLSIVSFVKASRQAFYNNNPDRYGLPTSRRERDYLLRYLRNGTDSTGLFTAFVDSSLQTLRISTHVADIGSTEMDKLINQVVYPKIDSVFGGTEMEVKITGSTLLFIEGNKFLIENLRFSLLLAFIIISIIMGMLFANVRMVVISLIPNILPLLFTAGIMGFMGIPLKPSTALIFSIAFGISVDDSIHFLAKYRQELFANNFFVPLAISKSIRETGASMIYTSIILFAGFIIFAGSNFGGTVALGILTSTTLLIAMITNLVLLPSLILSFDDGKRKKDMHPIIEQYDSEYHTEFEDEELDLTKLSVNSSERDSEVKQEKDEKGDV